MLRQWSPINEFYFVVNDKYKGVNADSEMAIQKIKSTYNLKEAAILTAKDIENMVFKLEDDQILSITGSIPDPKTKNLDYTVLNEVIEHIMLLPLNAKSNYKITLPNWEDKIKFNNLSSETAGLLNSGYTHIQSLEEYLSNNGNFLADALRDQINDIYCQERNKNHGDDLFWAIVERLSPKSQSMYQITVIIIMSKYFETCDIFEEPLEKNDFANKTHKFFGVSTWLRKLYPK